MTLKTRLSLIVGLLPASSLKNRLLRTLGHYIDQSAHVGPILLLRCTQLSLGKNAALAAFSVYKDMERVVLADQALLGGFNLVSSHPAFARQGGFAATLELGHGAYVTSRHTIDASGGVLIEKMSALGGHGTSVLTHSIDFEDNVQTCAPVVVRQYSFVAGRVSLLPGAIIPTKSLVASGATITARELPPGLIAGVPGKRVAPATGEWFSRSHPHTKTIRWRRRNGKSERYDF
jgi:acetyltransferase-like isoleucine patch superfamily enzyme